VTRHNEPPKSIVKATSVAKAIITASSLPSGIEGQCKLKMEKLNGTS